MKKNFLLITGGTGGHVIPAKNFANFLNSNKINCTIITDNPLLLQIIEGLNI